jgi:hypothetical protein
MKWIPSSDDVDTGRRRVIRWVLVIVLLGGVALGIAQKLRGPEPSQTIDPASFRPAEQDYLDGPNRSLEPLKDLDAALELPEPLEAMYLDQRGRRGRYWREPAFAMWMRRAWRMRQIPLERARETLDAPAPLNLYDRPGRYLGRGLRLEIYPVRLVRLDASLLAAPATAPATETAPARAEETFWTAADGPVWRIDAVCARADDPADRPLHVFCPFDPRGQIGLLSPLEIDGRAAEGAWEVTEPRAQRCEAMAVYYNLYPARTNDGRELRVPALIAWQLASGDGEATDGWEHSTSMILFGVVLVLLFGVIFLKRRQQSSGASTYRPLRDETAGQAGDPSAPREDEK